MSKVTISVSISALVALLDGQTKPMLIDVLSNLTGASTEGAAATVAAIPAAPAPATQSVADRALAFLAVRSDYDWRSAKAIGEAIGASTGEVESAVRGSGRFRARQSSRGLGLLVQAA